MNFDFDQTRQFLNALNKPPGTLRLRAFLPSGHALKAEDKGRKGPPNKEDIIRWQQEGRGIYAVINDGGDTDKEITHCRAFFCEWDDRPKEWQITAWKELGLPEPTIQVDTGGKSIHNYWVLSAPITPAHWAVIQKRLLEHADADRSLKNPSRVMRLPGTFHIRPDGTPGAMASVVHVSENYYTAADIEQCLPSEYVYERLQHARQFRYDKTHTVDEIRQALGLIPARVPGGGTYPMYRNILWGLVKALEEAGGTEDTAIAMMEAHSPQWTGIRQVAASGGENITAASFWYWAKEHGWARTIDTTAVQVPSSQPQRPTPEIVDDLVPATKAMPTRASEPEGGIPLDSKNSDYLTAALGEVFQLKDTQWICVDGILHQWRDTHYEAVPDDELTPQIADYLSRLYYHDKTEIIHHWAKPKFVNEVLSWFRQRLGNTPANPQNSINCRNGVITWDWNDRDELRIDFSQHSPSFPFTYVTDFDYDPKANPEHMWKLLAAVEPDDLDTMQRILGSSLDLRRYRAVRGRPRAMLMIGSGSNGKDTIRTALRDTLGARNFASCTLADFRQYDQGRKFPLAPLRDASINWSSENSQFVHIDGLQALKGAISGEELAWEVKGVQESNFVPSCLFVFNLNKEPSLSGEQAAIETRFHVFQFKKTFVANPSKPHHVQADPRLKDDPAFISRHICPAFLNWLLEGLKLSVEHGINYDSGREAMRAVRRKGSHLWDFCDDVGLSWKEDSQVPLLTVWTRLSSWYETEGFKDANGRWLIDPSGDPPVKAIRLLSHRLQAIFPELRIERKTETRGAMLIGLDLPPSLKW
jgi:phage/plasmid-associated DNA primase